MSEPERWSVQSSELTPAERRALAAGRQGTEVPAGAQQAVWDGIAATLAAGVAGAATGSAKVGLTAGALAKQLAIGALLGAAVTGGATLFERSQLQSPTPGARAPSGAVVTSSSAPPAHDVHAVATERTVSPAAGRGAILPPSAMGPRPAALPSARQAAVAYGSGQASFPSDTSDARVTAESRRLVAARRLLHSGRPGEALRALASIRVDFPAGALVQEREALEIEALLASGDRAAARARAAAFLTRYPESPHADSARKALR